MLIDIVETRVMNRQVIEPMEILALAEPQKDFRLVSRKSF